MSEPESKEMITLSKHLLVGVDKCSKQLDIMKSQLDTFLSKINSENGTNKRSKLTLSGNGDANTNDIHETESSLPSASGNEKDESYVAPYYSRKKDPKKGRGRPLKNFNNFPNGRGRPKKSVAKDTVESSLSNSNDLVKKLKTNDKHKGRGRPKKSVTVNYNEASDSTSNEDQMVVYNQVTKIRGRPKKSNIVDDIGASDSNSNENEMFVVRKNTTSAKGRGRPKKSVTVDDIEANDSNTNENEVLVDKKVTSGAKGRGRPKKSITVDDIEASDSNSNENEMVVDKKVTTNAKCRGRPKKSVTVDNTEVSNSSENEMVVDAQATNGKDRGRPKKSDPLNDSIKEIPNNGNEAVKVFKSRGRPSKRRKVSQSPLGRERGRPMKSDVLNDEEHDDGQPKRSRFSQLDEEHADKDKSVRESSCGDQSDTNKSITDNN